MKNIELDVWTLTLEFKIVLSKKLFKKFQLNYWSYHFPQIYHFFGTAYLFKLYLYLVDLYHQIQYTLGQNLQ